MPQYEWFKCHQLNATLKHNIDEFIWPLQVQHSWFTYWMKILVHDLYEYQVVLVISDSFSEYFLSFKEHSLVSFYIIPKRRAGLIFYYSAVKNFELRIMNSLVLWSVERVPGYRSRGPGSIRGYQISWKLMGLERGPLNLVSTVEELLGRKSSGYRSRKSRLRQ
jgi:hypothetical protein